MKNILLIFGGGKEEHSISIQSAKFIADHIDQNQFQVHQVEITKDSKWVCENTICEIDFQRNLSFKDKIISLDYAIPCIHGYPGESGEIQAFFDLIQLPYLGCNSEASITCFNKLTTKLWLENLGIQTAPFLYVEKSQKHEISKYKDFLNAHKTVYVKATNQGSSIGCFRCQNETELIKAIDKAFHYSPHVIIEKEILGRELEVATFQFEGQLHVTAPGEILCPSDFYSYDEKYLNQSQTSIQTIAPNISGQTLKEIKRLGQIAFEGLKLKDLARIDFFLTPENHLYINEINTFPGHTQISMFPMMMEAHGVKYADFIHSHLQKLA